MSNFFVAVLSLAVCCRSVLSNAEVVTEIRTISANEFVGNFQEDNDHCRHENIVLGDKFSPACITEKCGRRIVDGIFTEVDMNKLHEIVNKGMSYRESLGGPTILDINTGYIRDSAGLDNLFTKNTDIYTQEDFAHYGRIIRKLKDTVAETFHISDVYFTAPTFITRLDGDSNKAWKPQGVHDEYWHPHADMNNTQHYHYSGLLYMSTYNKDFTGGRFKFLSNDSPLPELDPSKPPVYVSPEDEIIELIVEPKAGRTIIFTAGPENTHYVEQVTSGERFVLSFWFTCDQKKEFQIFLDGQAHTTFSHKMRDAMASRNKKASKQATAQQSKNQKGKKGEKSEL